MKISLLVIRCENLEVSKNFYQLLGLSFTKEKHGNGPTHYSCEENGTVFELYPNNGKAPQDNNRLGFKVSGLTKIISLVDVIDSYEYLGNITYVVLDPDGRKIELSE
ncbi:VOC family protein [Leucothrix sargassi]|nr:VOC family protein [Leucothrix sargassi]